MTQRQLLGDLKLPADKKLRLFLDLDCAEWREDPKMDDFPFKIRWVRFEHGWTVTGKSL